MILAGSAEILVCRVCVECQCPTRDPAHTRCNPRTCYQETLWARSRRRLIPSEADLTSPRLEKLELPATRSQPEIRRIIQKQLQPSGLIRPKTVFHIIP